MIFQYVAVARPHGNPPHGNPMATQPPDSFKNIMKGLIDSGKYRFFME